MRCVGSSHVDPFSATAAATAALYGPLHGGANEAVLRMIEEIGDKSKVPAFIEGVKQGSGRLMGFGHRVYKNFDPRATILKKAADEVLGQMGIEDPLLDIAKHLEEVALRDSYFVERKLYPNVDFYSGILYRAMGIPTNMFTVMFALGRLPGWIAHWKEQKLDVGRIGRPRQIYVGPKERKLVPLAER